MNHTYAIIFCLFFGGLFLGTPQAYSTSQVPYVNQTVMLCRKVHFGQHNAFSKSCVDTDSCVTKSKELIQIEKAILMSPVRCLVVVKGYLHSTLGKSQHSTFPEVLINILSDFVVKKRYYQRRVRQIISCCVKDKAWSLLTHLLEKERACTSLAVKSSLFIDQLKPHHIHIYLYKNNFLKEDFLLWLLNSCGWPVPKKEQIKAYEAHLIKAYLFYFINSKERKVIAYKIACARSLKKGKRLVYKVQCFHLLTKQRIDTPASSMAIHKLQGRIFAEKSYMFRLVSFLSTTYWQQLDDQTFIDGDNIAVDLLYTISLMVWPFSGLFLMCLVISSILFMKNIHKLRVNCPILNDFFRYVKNIVPC